VHINFLSRTNKEKKRKENRNINVSTLTYDVCSPSLIHGCVNMGCRGSFVFIFKGGLLVIVSFVVSMSIYHVGLLATSHTRMRARDYYTSGPCIGGKGGAGPSLLHTTLEGPT
jgi:hypothetical protein